MTDQENYLVIFRGRHKYFMNTLGGVKNSDNTDLKYKIRTNREWGTSG